VFFIGVIATLIGFIAHKIPLISIHGKTIKICGLIIFVIGVYLEGALSMESHWREKINELEEKVRVAEENAKKINTEIEYVYVDRIKEVKKIEYIVKEKIRDSQNELNANCVISPKVAEILNSSAQNKVEEVKK
jgi:hypothetical protein